MIFSENKTTDKSKARNPEKNKKTNRKTTLLSITLTALMSVVIILCSYITVPAPVPFTMQTFGVFLALLMLGGKGGTIAILIYVLLGVAGFPVFSAFGSGVGYLLGPTGGYILGFVLGGVFCMLASGFGKNPKTDFVILLACLFICYLTGTLWFLFSGGSCLGVSGIWQAVCICVLPYIIPDTAKLFLALYVSKRLKSSLKL